MCTITLMMNQELIRGPYEGYPRSRWRTEGGSSIIGKRNAEGIGIDTRTNAAGNHEMMHDKVEKAQIEALKEKAKGDIQSISENIEAGEVTIRIKV